MPGWLGFLLGLAVAIALALGALVWSISHGDEPYIRMIDKAPHVEV